jgi:hypothetical protein
VTLHDTVTILGRDDVGIVAEVAEGTWRMRYYLTDCCQASAKGSANSSTGVCCRGCYREIDPALGGLPAQDGPVPTVEQPQACFDGICEHEHEDA